MDETTKLQLTVTQEAAERIAMFAPGPRSQGRWLSDLLENYEPEQEPGILERIESKLDRILNLLEKR